MASFKKWRGISGGCSSHPSAAAWKRLYAAGSAAGKGKPTLPRFIDSKSDYARDFLKKLRTDPYWLLVGNATVLSMNVVGLIGHILTIQSTYEWISGAHEKERLEREEYKVSLLKMVQDSVEQTRREVLELSTKRYQDLKAEWADWRKEVEDKMDKMIRDAAAAAASDDAASDDDS